MATGLLLAFIVTMDREDDTGRRLETCYANHFRIGFNRDEVVLDVGHAFGGEQEAYFWRIVCSPPYALALSVLLRDTLGKYEAEHGAIDGLEES